MAERIEVLIFGPLLTVFAIHFIWVWAMVGGYGWLVLGVSARLVAERALEAATTATVSEPLSTPPISDERRG